MADYRAELDDAVAEPGPALRGAEAGGRASGSARSTTRPTTRERSVGLFAVAWDYPNVEPPDYLWRSRPSSTGRSRSGWRPGSRRPCELAERAFLEEFARLVGHLTERITGGDEDGTPKVFRDSAVDNLCRVLRAVPLAERPQQRSSSTSWSAEAQRVGPRASGPGPARQPSRLRQRGRRGPVAGSSSRWTTMLVDRPRRRILRSRPPGGGG